MSSTAHPSPQTLKLHEKDQQTNSVVIELPALKLAEELFTDSQLGQILNSARLLREFQGEVAADCSAIRDLRIEPVTGEPGRRYFPIFTMTDGGVALLGEDHYQLVFVFFPDENEVRIIRVYKHDLPLHESVCEALIDAVADQFPFNDSD